MTPSWKTLLSLAPGRVGSSHCLQRSLCFRRPGHVFMSPSMRCHCWSAVCFSLSSPGQSLPDLLSWPPPFTGLLRPSHPKQPIRHACPCPMLYSFFSFLSPLIHLLSLNSAFKRSRDLVCVSMVCIVHNNTGHAVNSSELWNRQINAPQIYKYIFLNQKRFECLLCAVNWSRHLG